MAATTGREEHRVIDTEARVARGLDKRFEQNLIDATNGGMDTMVRYVATPPGEGSPAGPHIHEFDQLFYIVAGVMNIEIEGDLFEAGPGSLVVFRQGVRHRNWNGGSEETIHLAINTPMPDPDKPLAIPV